MTDSRKAIINLAEVLRDGDMFISKSLNIMLNNLQKTPKNKGCETKSSVQSILSRFSIVIMACLAICRGRRPFKDIESMEESLKNISSATQIQFIEKVLAPRCTGNIVAAEIIAFFLWADHCDISGKAKSVLERPHENSQSKEIISTVLKKWLSRGVSALSILAKDDPETASLAFNRLTLKDECGRHEAFTVLASGTLSREDTKKVADFLKSKESKSIWTGVLQRELCCDFVKYSFENDLLSKETAVELLKKAFQFEGLGRSLKHLLAALNAVDPENKQLLISGFSEMEKKENRDFSFRKENVKNFLSELTEPEKIAYLCAGLAASADRDFLWFAGRELIATDAKAAAKIFVKIAKARKTSAEKVGTLTQLATRMWWNGKKWWSVEIQGKKSQAEFAPAANALFDFAESDECPEDKRFRIAFEPAMFGGAISCRRRAIPILAKTFLDENSSAEKKQSALVALLNIRINEKELASKIDSTLKNIFESPSGELLLDQLLFILANDVRGYPNSPLFPAIVDFLVGIDPDESIPIFEKALAAKKPDADLGMSARQAYIKGLQTIALIGNAQAISAISRYRRNNIWGELIPSILIELYQKATTPTAKSHIAQEVANRFLYSVSQRSREKRISYFDELKAIEALSAETAVQKSFLEGLSAISNSGQFRSAGMCQIIKKTFSILPKNKHQKALAALNQLQARLTWEKEAFVAECQEKGLPYHRSDYLKTLNSINSETILTIASM
jgi:hypothetical protein